MTVIITKFYSCDKNKGFILNLQQKRQKADGTFSRTESTSECNITKYF